ncbi:zyg eleven-related protein 1 [Ditylenchus destructor]|uniref:Zyg eleven-related protein 1 n=1 Tax=Ditylenchus destructor TaxID=166010 RepID=A0AAD4MMD7_9BILA|nr:zyg eleven-related protein 1 [Ditylenchus destructor]
MIAADVVVKHVCKNLRNESFPTETVAKNLRPFLQGERQPLGRLDLSGVNISDRTLAELLAAQQSTLTSLDLSHTTGLNSAGVCSILTDLKVGALKLSSLKVTNCDLLRIPRFRLRGMRAGDSHAMHMANALPVVSQDDLNLGNDLAQEIARGNELVYDGPKLNSAIEANPGLIGQIPHFIQFCPNIQHLYLLQGLSYNIEDENADEFLFRIFESLRSLRTLDLSEWHFPNHLQVLENVPNLTTLILYDVQNLESSIPVISGLKNLRRLDLSQSERMTGQYSQPVTCLHTLVTELPNLECLDISGTNLTAAASDDDRPYRGMGLVASDIAGLSFLRRPLKYLGIFNCDNAPHFQNIPAVKICGDHGEHQIILALETYMSRSRMMQAVLNESYQLYRFGSGLDRHVEALHLVLQALSSHRTNSSLQIAGSALMFYIIRNVKMNRDTKRAVIYALLNGMVSAGHCFVGPLYINYSSFKPILRLLPMFQSPGSQHWAVWALANLTSTDLAKYCRYVEEEGGEELLRVLAIDDRPSPKIRELAGIVLTNMESWRRNTAEGQTFENDLEMVDA